MQLHATGVRIRLTCACHYVGGLASIFFTTAFYTKAHSEYLNFQLSTAHLNCLWLLRCAVSLLRGLGLVAPTLVNLTVG
jgi:hypothetical protein